LWWGLGSTYSFRELFRYTYLTRGRYRVVRRSLEDSLKLASLARELAQVYLEVVVWGERRVLRLRS
jgi:hypothetical protein